jgi:hypothetical protein
LEEKKYYVYILLNPKKPGEYKYENISLEYEPFYVGKGTGKRAESHYKGPVISGNTKKENLIEELKLDGFEPMFKKVFFSNNSRDTLDYEKELIFGLGRDIFGSGPLLNIQGSSLIKLNPDTKLYKNSIENKDYIKRTIDFPNELYELVMEYGRENSMPFFQKTIIDIINNPKRFMEFKDVK